MATKLSRKRRSPSNKLSELLWEPDDAYTLTTEDIDRGWFEHQLIHPRINYKLLVRCKVNAGEYAHTDMIVDETTGVVHVTLGGWETVDEYVRFQYYYRHGGRLVPAPDPVPVTPTWRLITEVADYEDTDGVYHYPSGPMTGNISTFYIGYNGDYQMTVDYSLLDGATFADLGVVGWKVAARCTGDPGSSGHVGFVINLDNPGGVDAWAGGGSYVTIDSYWGSGGVEGSIPVTAGVTEVFEHEFPVNGTSSDPYFHGWNYDNMLDKLEKSMRSTIGGYAHLTVELEGAGLVGGCVVEQFDIILIGTP